jgi:Zn-finger nucleic acid-binding protein
MLCPKCKNVPLEKTSPDKPYWCPVCGGMWVSIYEIGELSEPFVDDLRISLADAAMMDARTGLCPHGHGIMIRAKVEADHSFYLEKCTHCGGVWFDPGEWQQIAKHHLVENLADFWTTAWQKQKNKEKDRESFIALNKRLIGDEAVQLILRLSEILKNHPEKTRALALLKQELLQTDM